MWEKRGWLGYVAWYGTSGPSSLPYQRNVNGHLAGTNGHLTVTCVLTALVWIVTGWQLHAWFIATPAVSRLFRTWRVRLAFVGLIALPSVISVLFFIWPPGGGPGFGGMYAGAATGMVLTMSCYVAPVLGAIGYFVGRKIDLSARR